jgi:hypothetical protein
VRQLVAALWLGIVVVAGGCGGGNAEKSGASTSVTTAATTTVVTVSGRYHYAPNVINGFMRTCTQGDVARASFCGCVLDRLSNSVSLRDFARIARVGKAVPRVNRAIKQATLACGPKT